MSKSSKVVYGLSAALALGLPAIGTDAEAAIEYEKCYGVVKAGKNACAANAHPCMNQAKKDGDPNEWILLPKGTCEKLVNGSTQKGKK